MSWQWILWMGLTAMIAALLGTSMFFPEWTEGSAIERAVFLPGATTDGHYQIEMSCETCHTSNFSDRTVMQTACVDCHGAELEASDDSHPTTKFTDPRNADRVEVLDARLCITCHQEHRPEITSSMGLSLPDDYCYRCHENVGEERPTHRDLAFDSCASAGCHNFHDNKALYEDFLVEHRSGPDILPVSTLPALQPVPWPSALPEPAKTGLVAADQDGAPFMTADRSAFDEPIEDWAASGHADAGVNCTGCHQTEEAGWTDQPSRSVCRDCHAQESDGFEGGRHGMRLAAGLSAMTPGHGRLPMQPEAADIELDCNACHSAHRYDTQTAAVDACLGCHADDHSLAYQDSPHAQSGVSCATCHLPRVPEGTNKDLARVAHNQNDFLRPNEKMIRPVCMQCHSLAFSIDSLADPALIHTNFRGRPARKVESIHYASILRWQLEGKTPPWVDAEEENPK